MRIASSGTAQVSEARKNPPRLVVAQYRASVTDIGLAGMGEWKILSSVQAPPGSEDAGPAILPLESPARGFNLALRRVQIDSRDAVVGQFHHHPPPGPAEGWGGGLGLVVDQTGEHTATFAWSARGEQRPDGLHFDLQIPPSPIASLELTVPSDRRVTITSEGCLLAGPQPAEMGQSLWRISFAGRPGVHIVLVPRLGQGEKWGPIIF